MTFLFYCSFYNRSVNHCESHSAALAFTREERERMTELISTGQQAHTSRWLQVHTLCPPRHFTYSQLIHKQAGWSYKCPLSCSREYRSVLREREKDSFFSTFSRRHRCSVKIVWWAEQREDAPPPPMFSQCTSACELCSHWTFQDYT